jgi:hypothetical protein
MISLDAVMGTLLQRTLFDFDFLELVLWFPKLTWAEFATTAAVVAGWKALCDALDRVSGTFIRAMIADVLVRLAGWVRPV